MTVRTTQAHLMIFFPPNNRSNLSKIIYVLTTSLTFAISSGLILSNVSSLPGNLTAAHDVTALVHLNGTNLSASLNDLPVQYVVYPPGSTIDAKRLDVNIKLMFHSEVVQTISTSFTGIVFWVITMSEGQRTELLDKSPTVSIFSS